MFPLTRTALSRVLGRSRHCQCLNVKLHTSARSLIREDDHEEKEKKMVLRQKMNFDEIGAKYQRNKQTFKGAIDTYKKREGVHNRGSVEFIYAAMKKMKEFEVHKDIDVYKYLLQVFPPEKMVARNTWQVEMQHYPKQQQCCIDLLCMMEENGVIPDDYMGNLIVKTFGHETHAMRKYQRMMYWMPKFSNLNPWPIPKILPKDPTELARIALRRMAVDLENIISVDWTRELEGAYDKTFVVSAQAPLQREMITNHPEDTPLFVEGGFHVWAREKQQVYFILKAEANPLKFGETKPVEKKKDDDAFDWTKLQGFFTEDQPKDLVEAPNLHEQEDGTILAMCITGTASKDSLKSWIRFLERSTPNLANIPVVFKLRTPDDGLVIVDDDSPLANMTTS